MKIREKSFLIQQNYHFYWLKLKIAKKESTNLFLLTTFGNLSSAFDAENGCVEHSIIRFASSTESNRGPGGKYGAGDGIGVCICLERAFKYFANTSVAIEATKSAVPSAVISAFFWISPSTIHK